MPSEWGNLAWYLHELTYKVLNQISNILKLLSICNQRTGLSLSNRDVQEARGWVNQHSVGEEPGTAGRARRSAAAGKLTKLTKHAALDKKIGTEYWQHLLPLSRMSFPRTFPSREAGSHLARPQRFHTCYCFLLFQMPGGNVIQKERAGRGKYGHELLQRHKKEALTEALRGTFYSPLRQYPHTTCLQIVLVRSNLEFLWRVF